jgi:PEP-CTERM/exosortase A-associated glycosyltransferase
MRVLHLCHSTYPDTTGASIRSRYLVETQAQLGIEPIVLSSPFQPPADASQARGVESLHGIPYYRCFDPRYDQRFMVARKPLGTRIRKLTAISGFTRFARQIAREQHAKVIHGHSLFFCGLAAVFAARGLGIPSIYEVRSLIEDTLVREGGASEGGVLYRAYRWFDDLATRLADHVVAISDGLRRDLIERGVPASRITVVGNGVDTAAQAPAPPADPALRADLGLPPDAFVVGYIGTLFNYESLEMAIEAVATLRARHPRLRLMIVGTGPARDALVTLSAQRGVQEIVRFVDRVSHEEVGRYYGLVDLFVLPRRSNRLTDLVTPLKPLEIMARAKPVLASDCGGHRELIVAGENGLLYDAGSSAALADALATWQSRSPELTDLGRRARTWVAQHRSWRSAVEPTVGLYDGLVARRRPRSVPRSTAALASTTPASTRNPT